MHAAEAHPACPVCALPTGPDAYCECGWELRVPRRLGPVTAAMRAEFDHRLASARLEFDARAAALITAEPGRFAPWMRGTPDGAQWAAARRRAAAAAAGALDEDSARKELAAALRSLDHPGQALIIEIGPAGVGAVTVVLDASGTPHFDPDQSVHAWSEPLPGPPAHPDERLLRLAGGYGGPGRAALRDYLDEAIPAAYGDEVLVICRPAGWTLLEEAASQVALMFPGARLLRVSAKSAAAGGEVGVGGTLGPLTASMPLLRGYGVVVASVDPVTGMVAPATRPLFQPGDPPGTQASVTLRRFPGDRNQATLAVAIDAAWSTEPHVVAVHTVPQPEQPRYRVSAVLDPAGRVRFTEPRGVTEDGRPWADVWAAVPRQVDVRPAAVDLVCAVELGGKRAQVRQRRDLVRELLEEIAREYPDEDCPRVSVIGCADHVYAPGEESRRVVRGIPLGPLDEAREALAELRSDEIRYPDAAPLEDLLHDAYRMLAASRAAGRVGRLLLVAAGRRPHPKALTVSPVPGARIVQPCPQRHDWRNLLRQLDKAGVLTVAVADSPARPVRAGFWAEAARDGLHTLSSVTAQSVGADLGLFVRTGQRTGLPLPALTRTPMLLWTKGKKDRDDDDERRRRTHGAAPDGAHRPVGPSRQRQDHLPGRAEHRSAAVTRAADAAVRNG